MAKSVLKRAKHLLKRSLATSVALVVAMVAVSLSLATKITYAVEQTLTESEVTVTGDFDKTITKLNVKDWTNADPNTNATYDSLKGYIEEGYEQLKALELTVSPEDATVIGDLTITFTLGDEYNGREARVWYHDVNGTKVSTEDTLVTNGELYVYVKNLETFMITLKQATTGENEPGDGNNENSNGENNNTSNNNNENASGDNGNASGNNNNSSKKNSKGNVKTDDSSLALRVSSIVLLTISATGMLLFKKKREAYHFN